MNIIDLFSGAGGLTEGFRDQFKIIDHVEKEYAACETLKLRDSFYYLEQNDLLDIYFQFLSGRVREEDIFDLVPEAVLNKTINAEINDDTLRDIFKKIDADLKNQSVIGIIGGPPCQAYSTIGRARNAAKKSTDERIFLYKYYIDFLNKYRPLFFVFENVRGLLSFRDANNELLFPKMQYEFRGAGYNLKYRIINAADYGVPQVRERIIIFGAKADYSDFPEKFFKNLESMKKRRMTVKEAFTGLPKLHAGETKNIYAKETSSLAEEIYRKNKSIPLTENVSRPNNDNDLKIYKIVAKAKQNGKNIRYNELDDSLLTHKNTNEFLDRYKALSWDLPAHTIVAHIAKDGHHFIHPDPEQNRSITVREAARLQGFPDDYYFENSRTAAFTQIGNAVPPILSKKIAKAVYLTIKTIS
ncbi:MAG: DNA cytosine methyltransferase [Gilliamella sp.]|nr:DNA cytosine methyltransferase [Gilliamella sp.]MCO6557751.1 DNA cytosine methyltransferase [Gilliamella sp.]